MFVISRNLIFSIVLASLLTACASLPNGGLSGAAGVQETLVAAEAGSGANPDIAFYSKPTIQISSDTDGAKPLSALTVASLGIGNYQVVFPSKLKVKEMGIVELIIAPASVEIKKNQSSPLSASGQSLEIIQDSLDIYPYMSAELTGDPSFTVSAEIHAEKAIISASPTQWSWIIEPSKAGNHILILTISVPIQIDGESAIYELKSLKLIVLVDELATPSPAPTTIPTPTQLPSFESQIQGSALESIGVAVGVLTLIVTMVFSYLNFSLEKKKVQEEKEARVRAIKLEDDKQNIKADMNSIEQKRQELQNARGKQVSSKQNNQALNEPNKATTKNNNKKS